MVDAAGGWDGRTSYLLAALGAHVQIAFARLLEPLGLSPQQFGVLRRLCQQDNRTQQELADALRIRRSVMVGVVDLLEERRLVERRRHPADRRANALHVTAAGRRAVERVAASLDALDAELIAALPPGDRAHFAGQLQLLAAATGVADGVYPVADGGAAAPARELPG